MEMCHKHRRRLGSSVRRNLCDNLQSISSKVNLLSNNTFELLQPEFLEEEISGISSDDLSNNKSNKACDEDASDDDLDWIHEGEADEATSMSDISSDDDNNNNNNSNSTFADDELGSNDTESGTPSTSAHAWAFNELKNMYTHHYEEPCKQLPKSREPFMKHLLKTLKVSGPTV
jgi:hypothetical protein